MTIDVVRYLCIGTAILAPSASAVREAGAQMHITRNVIIAPIMPGDSGPGVARDPFPQPRFFIEAARGWGSVAGEQAWNIKFGGMFQIRLGERSALVGLFGHELTSNPYNDLGYNPRGAMWDENALYVRHTRFGDWHGGVFFRCRHELDNADGSDERLPDSLRTSTARILGLGGVMTGLSTRELSFSSQWKARAFVRVEGYFHRKDDRAPISAAGPDFREAIGSGGTGLRVSRELRRGLTAYARGWATAMAFSAEADGPAVALNARGEIGIRGWGLPAGMDLHLGYERFFDDLSRPVPQRNRALFAGLRVSASEFF